MTEPGTCVAVHRHEPERPRRAVGGGYLCTGHLSRLRALLVNGWPQRDEDDTTVGIPALFAELARALPSGGEGGEPVTGTPAPALPFRPRVSAHLPDVEGRLFGWCRVVAEDRAVHLPEFPSKATRHDPGVCGYRRPRHTYTPPGEVREVAVWNEAWTTCPRCGWTVEPVTPVAVMCAWLDPHLDWIARQEWVDAFMVEVEDMAAEALRLLDTQQSSSPYEIPNERCPECAARLYVIRRREEPTVVRCGGEEPHEWDSTQFRRLGHRLRRDDGERMGA